MSLAAAGLAVGITGAGMDAFGKIKAGKDAAKSRKRAAESASINAALTEEYVRREANLIRKQGRKLAGAQVAAAGASGIQMSGSILDVINETAEQTEFAALDQLYQGKMAMLGQAIEARSLRNEGAAGRAASSFGAGAGILGALGAGFRVASSLGSSTPKAKPASGLVVNENKTPGPSSGPDEYGY